MNLNLHVTPYEIGTASPYPAIENIYTIETTLKDYKFQASQFGPISTPLTGELLFNSSTEKAVTSYICKTVEPPEGVSAYSTSQVKVPDFATSADPRAKIFACLNIAVEYSASAPIIWFKDAKTGAVSANFTGFSRCLDFFNIGNISTPMLIIGSTSAATTYSISGTVSYLPVSY